jgi:uncharacterized protein YbjT (DUF2867 family)
LPIAVTGASGWIGGQVVRLLAAEQPHQVVALSRRGLPSGRRSARVSARAADYADPEALGAALRGVDTLVFVSSDGPVAEVIVHHQNVIRAAGDSGVAHIVALSGLDADLSSPFCYAVSYGYTERLLAESGCSVSIARASIYSEFFIGFLARARASGQLRLPASDGRISLVSRGAWRRWPWGPRAAATMTSPAPSLSAWLASQPWPRASGAPRSSTSTSRLASIAWRWQSPVRTRGGCTHTPRCSHRSGNNAGRRSPDEVHRLTGRLPTPVHSALARYKTA